MLWFWEGVCTSAKIAVRGRRIWQEEVRILVSVVNHRLGSIRDSCEGDISVGLDMDVPPRQRCQRA